MLYLNVCGSSRHQDLQCYYVQDYVRSWAAAYSFESCLPVAKMESIYIRNICEIVVVIH